MSRFALPHQLVGLLVVHGISSQPANLFWNALYWQILPLDEVAFVILSGSDGRKCFWSQLNNSKMVRDRPCVSSLEGGLSNKPIPDPHAPLRPKLGSKSSPFKVQPTGLRLMEMSIEHILGWLVGCELMPWTIVKLSPKPQMSERKSSTIYAVIERPDHHYDDDLVAYLEAFSWKFKWGLLDPRFRVRAMLGIISPLKLSHCHKQSISYRFGVILLTHFCSRPPSNPEMMAVTALDASFTFTSSNSDLAYLSETPFRRFALLG